MTTSFTTNETTYTTTSIKIKNTEYKVTVATGKFNYVNVHKVTANPYGICGKNFKDFNEAASNYKNPQMKIELLKIELGLN